jgi:hypothetical protein
MFGEDDALYSDRRGTVDPLVSLLMGGAGPHAPRQQAMAPEMPAPDIPATIPQSAYDPLQSLIGTRSMAGPSPPKQTRGDMFRTMLSTFIYSLGEGMKASGTGPGANIRGAGAALVAPFERADLQRQIGLRERQVASQEASAKALEDLRAAQEQALIPSIEVQGPNGEALKIAPRDLGAYIAKGFWLKGMQIAATTKKETTAATIASKEKIEANKLSARKKLDAAKTELAKAQAEVAQGKVDPESPLYQQKEREINARIQAAQANIALRERSLELSIERMNRPTTAARDRASFAAGLREHIPDVIEQINALDRQGKLGAISGRFNEFMTGKVGADDPDFAQLRTSLGLLQTGMMVPHVGARGGVQLIKKFEGLINQGKASAGNLKASLGEMDKFLETYSRLPEIQREQQSGRGAKQTGGTGKKWNAKTGRYE